MKIITPARLQLIAKIGSLQEIQKALLALATEAEKEEKRLSMQRARTQRCLQKREFNAKRDFNGEKSNEINENVNLTIERDFNGQRDFNGVNLTVPIYSKKESKEVSKKESKNSSRHVSAKRCQIPSNLICSEKNLSDALRIGIPQEFITHEWQKFHDHHLAKGTLGVDWNAAWRRWCQNHLDWNKNKTQSSAKPLTFRQQVILRNQEVTNELVKGAYNDIFLKPAAENPQTALGSPVKGIVSGNGKSANSGNAAGNGDFNGELFGKGLG